MKNIFKSLMLSLLIVTVSCENDDKTSVTSPDAPVLLNPAVGEVYTLRPDNAENLAATFVWNHAEYGVQTAVNYSVEFAEAGTNFATVIDGGSPFDNQKFKSYTVAQLNQIATDAGTTPFADEDIEVRIKAWLGSDESTVVYSAPVTIKINRFTNELPKLAVPGNHQGWSPASAPLIASSGYGKTDFEGYMQLDGGFKILSPKADGTFDWGTQDWGDDGSFSGMLKDGDGEVNIEVVAGYYRLQADTEELTYKATAMNWGIVGSATPGGWDNSTPLVYNPDTKLLEATVTLVAGEYKFRANNGWDVNLGAYEAGKEGAGETMSYGGANIALGAGGSYKVVLDLRDPRNYKYSVTPN